VHRLAAARRVAAQAEAAVRAVAQERDRERRDRVRVLVRERRRRVLALAVSTSSVQLPSPCTAGRAKRTGAVEALSRRSIVSPRTGRPRSSLSSAASPEISMPIVARCGACQSASDSSRPSWPTQVRSFAPALPTGRPWKKLRRRSTGFAWRIAKSRRVKPRRLCCQGARFQLTQVVSLSCAYALLLPRCVRPSSSPWASIGTPCEKASVARRPRIARRRTCVTAGSSVSPSAPQLRLMLFSWPSRFPSPLASLCLRS
jgi:hypothetical protein